MWLAWSKDDRDKATWQFVREKASCRHCGTRPDEWAEDRNAYTPTLGRCRGCEVLEAERDRHKNKPLGGGVYVTLQRR